MTEEELANRLFNLKHTITEKTEMFFLGNIFSSILTNVHYFFTAKKWHPLNTQKLPLFNDPEVIGLISKMKSDDPALRPTFKELHGSLLELGIKKGF